MEVCSTSALRFAWCSLHVSPCQDSRSSVFACAPDTSRHLAAACWKRYDVREHPSCQVVRIFLGQSILALPCICFAVWLACYEPLLEPELNLTVAWVVETLHYFCTERQIRIYIYIYMYIQYIYIYFFLLFIFIFYSLILTYEYKCAFFLSIYVLDLRRKFMRVKRCLSLSKLLRIFLFSY